MERREPLIFTNFGELHDVLDARVVGFTSVLRTFHLILFRDFHREAWGWTTSLVV